MGEGASCRSDMYDVGTYTESLLFLLVLDTLRASQTEEISFGAMRDMHLIYGFFDHWRSSRTAQ